jgi:hypothetical protein
MAWGSEGGETEVNRARPGYKYHVVNALPPDDEMLYPWEKQLDESDKAWEAFRTYRDMRSDRSLRALAASISAQRNRNETTTFRQVGEWSRLWRWVDRCDAFDRWEDNLARKAMLKRHLDGLKSAQQAFAQPLGMLIELHRQEPLLKERIAEEVLAGRRNALLERYERLLRLAVQAMGGGFAQLGAAERLARGMSTDNVAVAAKASVRFGDGDSEPFSRTREALDAAIEFDPSIAAAVETVLLKVAQARNRAQELARENGRRPTPALPGRSRNAQLQSAFPPIPTTQPRASRPSLGSYTRT